jgi:hypothetical protein
MRTLAGLAVVALAILALAPGTTPKRGEPPGRADVTLTASANPLTIAQPLTLKGSVTGAGAGLVVTLEARGPAERAFAALGTATTDREGGYSFTQRPRASTRYRVIAATAPPVRSPELLVRVRPPAGVVMSDPSPAAHARTAGTRAA